MNRRALLQRIERLERIRWRPESDAAYARAQARQAAVGRVVQEMQALRVAEAALDAKLARLATWSPIWWHTLGQVQIVRKQRIFLHQALDNPPRQT